MLHATTCAGTLTRLRLVIAGALVTALLSAGAVGAVPFTEGRLWRVSKPGIADSFVFGTIHVADPRVAIVPGPVEAALLRSRTLATEITVDAAAPARGYDLEELGEEQRLEPLLGAADFALLKSRLVAQDIPERSIERMKPWAALLKSTQSASGERGATLDERLYALARSRKLRVTPLETIEEQIAAFDAIPVATQVALLRHTLANREALQATTEGTIQNWLRGDLAALAQICQGTCRQFPAMHDHYARLNRHIVRDRTALLHHRLFQPLREGRVFVAIGAQHLHGDAGLLALLKVDGYRITRVW